MAEPQMVHDEAGNDMYMCPLCGSISDSRALCVRCCEDPEWPTFNKEHMYTLLADMLGGASFNYAASFIYRFNDNLSSYDSAYTTRMEEKALRVTMPDGTVYDIKVEEVNE